MSRKIGFWLLSCTWGVAITLIGSIAAVGLLVTGHKPHTYKGSVYFKVGKAWGGVNFGPFFFVDNKTTLTTVQHEWGHGIQNIIMGPFHLIFACCSFVRYHYRNFITSTYCPKRWRKTYRELSDYDSFWFEGWATNLGKKYYKEGDYHA